MPSFVRPFFFILGASKPSIYAGRVVATAFYANVLDCYEWTLRSCILYDSTVNVEKKLRDMKITFVLLLQHSS